MSQDLAYQYRRAVHPADERLPGALGRARELAGELLELVAAARAGVAESERERPGRALDAAGEPDAAPIAERDMKAAFATAQDAAARRSRERLAAHLGLG